MVSRQFSVRCCPTIQTLGPLLGSNSGTSQVAKSRSKGGSKTLAQELHAPLEPHLEALSKIRDIGVIEFRDLWLILAPGSLMLSCEGGDVSVSLLNRVRYLPETVDSPERYLLQLYQVDWDGTMAGIKIIPAQIIKYEEPKMVTRLNTYPLLFDPNQKEITFKAITRRRIFESLRGLHVKTCSGNKSVLKRDRVRGCLQDIQKPVSGRIIVDAFAYHHLQGDSEDALPFPELQPLTNKQPAATSTTKGKGNDDDSDDDELHVPVAIPDRPSAATKKQKGSTGNVTEGVTSKMKRREALHPMTDLDCTIAVSRVKGFDLYTKEWCEFNIDDIRDAAWDITPFNNLVLPQGEKDLVFAIVNQGRQDRKTFDDFVRQKGQGIVILLCGQLGVGKTLTAEAVAEVSKAPLYILSASDLGTEANSVDHALTNAFERCRLWNALLLLDEADVFLESRNLNNTRNELVSVFLRQLEYFQGLQFLMTNRLKSIDIAFKGRVDLILPYNGLNEDSRKSIWKNFIDRLGPKVADINEKDLETLSKSRIPSRRHWC